MKQAIIDSLTPEMRERIIKVCGHNFSYSDIPAYLRREKEDEFEQRKTESELNELKEEELKRSKED